jgi:uncharacterized protein YyaL (SSP411 family)
LNPVDWYPWGAEAFEKARKEEKPIFLSIGYSTCHWCHVMERESFEDKTIAAYLNEHFVAIKVDREERPDVDDVYMASVHAMGRRGGWPLSVFLTPEGKPFFGATYFPPDTFLRLCQSITEAWKTQRGELAAGAQRLTEHLQKEAEALRGESSLKAEALERAFGSFRDTHDARHGGFGSAPKFPRTSVLDFLLRYAVTRGARERGESEAALAMVERTLDGMVRGGIRDHLAGGFHRYSTDEVWLIPHFEKMLYDQALIASTLADSYRLTGNEVHREVAREILDYLLARMTGPEGEIYSAEDADTEGEEGKTYVWRRAEVLEILGKERGERFSRFYDVTEEGNFEEGGPGASVLRIVLPAGSRRSPRRRSGRSPRSRRSSSRTGRSSSPSATGARSPSVMTRSSPAGTASPSPPSRRSTRSPARRGTSRRRAVRPGSSWRDSRRTASSRGATGAERGPAWASSMTTRTSSMGSSTSTRAPSSAAGSRRRSASGGTW